jgi:hypothetical protein
VAPEVWEYRIGGFQVLAQWLKARAGQALGRRGIADLQAIAQALGQTVQIETRLAELPFA